MFVKKDESLRICLDPFNLNKNIRREHFPLPSFEEISSKLNDAKYFSTLVAMSAFWQIAIDTYSSDLCTFVTPLGKYKFLRLPFGISVLHQLRLTILFLLFFHQLHLNYSVVHKFVLSLFEIHLHHQHYFSV